MENAKDVEWPSAPCYVRCFFYDGLEQTQDYYVTMKKTLQILRRWWLPALLALVLVAVDQISKDLMILRAAQSSSESIPFWPGVLHLRLTHNEGVAFGLLQDGFVLPILLPVLALVLLPVLRRFVLPKGRLADFGVVIVMAGGFSNLLDKLLRGYVVDFFEIKLFRFAIFNVADIYVTVGIVLLLLAVLLPSAGKQQ